MQSGGAVGSWPSFRFEAEDGDRVGEVEVTFAYRLDDLDASCWRAPFTLAIGPAKNSEDQNWETNVDFTREQATLLRDCLNLFLNIPDRLERAGRAEDEAA